MKKKKKMEKLYRILEAYGCLDIFKNKGEHMKERRNDLFKELKELYEENT